MKRDPEKRPDAETGSMSSFGPKPVCECFQVAEAPRTRLVRLCSSGDVIDLQSLDSLRDTLGVTQQAAA